MCHFSSDKLASQARDMFWINKQINFNIYSRVPNNCPHAFFKLVFTVHNAIQQLQDWSYKKKEEENDEEHEKNCVERIQRYKVSVNLWLKETMKFEHYICFILHFCFIFIKFYTLVVCGYCFFQYWQSISV